MLERFSFIKCIKIAIEHARFIVSMGNGDGRIIIIIRKWKLIQMVNIKICQLFFSSLLCPIRSVHSFPMFFCACSKSARRLRPDCINEAKKRNRRGREVDSTSLIDANRIRKCYNTWQQEEEIIHSSLSLSGFPITFILRVSCIFCACCCSPISFVMIWLQSGIVIEVYTHRIHAHRTSNAIGSDEVGEWCHIERSDGIMNKNEKRNGKKISRHRKWKGEKVGTRRTHKWWQKSRAKKEKVFGAFRASLC